jgi:hypothetical protein
MCNPYSITINQAALIALFRVVDRYVGNLPPMPGVFPDYPAPAIRNTGAGTYRKKASAALSIRKWSKHWRWQARAHRAALDGSLSDPLAY